MSGERIDRFELGIDAGAAGVYAAAIALALFELSASSFYAAGAFAVAFAWCFAALRSVGPEPTFFALPDFVPKEFDPVRPDELILTEVDRVQAPKDDALVLDDILAELGPDSRVVRLFDPSKMPTAGQLKTRIDGYLEESESSAPPDASQALYDALAELKRSLR